MSNVRRQIDRARRRLTNGLLLDHLCFGLLITSASWAVAVLALRVLGLDWPVWHGSWMAAVATLAIAAVGVALTRPTPLAAAVRLDTSAGLKERLSTALVMERSTDPFARAAVKDAEKTAGNVHVPSHIHYRTPPLLPWASATTLAAIILAAFMPTLDLFAANPDATPTVDREAVRAERQIIETRLSEKLEELRNLSKDQQSLKDVIKDIDDKSLDVSDTPELTVDDVRREAMKKIDDVQDRLKQHLEDAERQVQEQRDRMLSGLKLEMRPEDQSKLSEALSEGDYESAREALNDMLKDLKEAAQNANDPAMRQKLDEMQKKLADLADKIAKLDDSVRLQKELENQAGLTPEEAKELLDKASKMSGKELEKMLQNRLGEKGLSQEQIKQIAKKMQQNQQAKQQLQKLAQNLSKAAQACQQCQQGSQNGQGGQGNQAAGQAAGALSDAMGQLSQMEMSEQLMQELEAQIADLQNFRQGVCQGNMAGPPKPPDSIGNQGPNYGMGLGERIGKERVASKFDPTKADVRYENGTVIGQMLISGPQIRGQATAEELAVVESQLRDAEDAIEHDPVPRQYHRVLREYFERLSGLAQKRAAEKAEAAEAAESTESGAEE